MWTGIAEPRNSTGPSEHGRTTEGPVELRGSAVPVHSEPSARVYPTLPRRRTSQRIQRITTAGAAGTMITIGEAMMEADVEAVVGVYTLMTGREVLCVSPTLSPTCHAIAGGLMSIAPTVNAWSPCPLHQHTSLLSHYLTRVHTHPLSTGK